MYCILWKSLLRYALCFLMLGSQKIKLANQNHLDTINHRD